MANYVIILAAGKGKRFEHNTPKCFVRVNNTPIYKFALNTFYGIKEIKNIILVVPKQYQNKLLFNDSRLIVVSGGKTRNDSFEKGIQSINRPKPNDKIIIHDAARINVSKTDVLSLIKSKEDYGTLCCKGKKNARDLRIKNYNILTPQFCKYFVYKNTKKFNKKGKDLFTYLCLKSTAKNFILSSSKNGNLKITFKGDLKLV